MTAWPCACCRACHHCNEEDRKRAMRRVYGKGYHDGIEAGTHGTTNSNGEKSMTPARQRAALQGQSAIAMKVYDAIPIAEAWEVHEILSTVQTQHRTHLDRHVLDGCLAKLHNSSLIRQDEKGRWQRVKVRDQPDQPETNGKEIVMPASNEKPALTLAPEAPPKPTSSTLEALATIAGRLREASISLKEAADELEAVALTVEEQTVDPDELAKLRQLRALLKTL